MVYVTVQHLGLWPRTVPRGWFVLSVDGRDSYSANAEATFDVQCAWFDGIGPYDDLQPRFAYRTALVYDIPAGNVQVEVTTTSRTFIVNLNERSAPGRGSTPSPPYKGRMRFQQVPRRQFPHGGLPMAQVAVDPDDLTSRFGVVFERSYDDLGDLILAAFPLSARSQAWLIRHLQAPYEGMRVIADAAHRPSDLVRMVVEALDLAEDQVLWQLADEDRGEPCGFY